MASLAAQASRVRQLSVALRQDSLRMEQLTGSFGSLAHTSPHSTQICVQNRSRTGRRAALPPRAFCDYYHRQLVMVTANYPIPTSAVLVSQFHSSRMAPELTAGVQYGVMRRRGPPPGSSRISVVSCGVHIITLAHEDRSREVAPSSRDLNNRHLTSSSPAWRRCNTLR